jgi:hypothetical protein
MGTGLPYITAVTCTAVILMFIVKVALGHLYQVNVNLCTNNYFHVAEFYSLMTNFASNNVVNFDSNLYFVLCEMRFFFSGHAIELVTDVLPPKFGLNLFKFVDEA